jgi:arylsulfatase
MRFVYAIIFHFLAAAPLWAGLAGARPNVIFLITDDQGYGDLSCHGHPILKTPHLDRLHKEGTRFTDFHVSPTCAPTRAALLTGRHEFRSGVTHTIKERERLSLKPQTLPEALVQAGYTTGIFGKWHLGDEPERWPNKRGFQEMFIHGAGGIGQTYPGSCGDAPGNRYQDPWVLHNGKFTKTTGYCTDVFFDAALAWVEKCHAAQKPFYCHIATNTPHAPLDARAEDEARYAAQVEGQEAKFYGMISNIDDNVGRLLAKLDQLGLTKNTLVVFINDNGGTVGCQRHNAGMRGTKGSPWLGGTRASSFWRWPGKIEPRDEERFACHWDFFPTLAELTGATIPAGQVEGRSLLPLLENKAPQWPERLFITHVGRWETGSDLTLARDTNVAVRLGSWTLVRAKHPGKKSPEAKWELFDLKADFGQKNDLAADQPERVEKLQKAYFSWWEQTVPHFENEAAPLPAENPFHKLFREQIGAK